MISLSKNEMLTHGELFKLEEELLNAHKRLLTLGDEYAQAREIFESLKGMKDTVKANAMPLTGPVGVREIEALKSEEYLTHLKGTSAANATYLLKESRYEAIQSYIDSLRTIISNRRTLISKGIDAR
jgi:hypothetical protein